MLAALLSIHLFIAFCLTLTFISRVVKLFKHQNSPNLRKFFYLLSGLIVVSGVALSIVGKVPITNICLESLGIVAVVTLLDFALVLTAKKQQEIDS